MPTHLRIRVSEGLEGGDLLALQGKDAPQGDVEQERGYREAIIGDGSLSPVGRVCLICGFLVPKFFQEPLNDSLLYDYSDSSDRVTIRFLYHAFIATLYYNWVSAADPISSYVVSFRSRFKERSDE